MLTEDTRLDELSGARFSACLGTRFRVDGGGAGCVELLLLEAVALPASACVGARARTEPFSLVFRGPRRPLLDQCMFAFKHDNLLRFVLFIVPIAPDAEDPRYEAVFN